MRKLAVVRAQLGEPNPDVLIFNKLPDFKTKYVGYTEDEEWLNDPCFTYVDIKKIVPDRISNFIVRKPYSPVSFVKLKNIKNALKDADVINCPEIYSFASKQCAEFAKTHGKSLAVTVWETIPALPINFLPPHSWNVRTVKELVDIFLAHTRRAADYLRRLSIPDESIRVIYPGIDIKTFSPSKKNYHDKFRILFVGRFDIEKGLSILLHAFACLYAKNPDVELWIRAKRRTGIVESLAYKYAQKYPIKFIGRVNYEELPKIYNECDVLCLPSFDRKKLGIKVWEEQFGFVLMEAMACGLPIIGSNCGAIPEVIGSENLIVRQKSVDDLYLALCKLIRDEEYRKRVSKLNRVRSEELFDIEKQRRKLAEILQKLIN